MSSPGGVPWLMVPLPASPHRAEGVQVALFLDGTATVQMNAVLVARRDVTGEVRFERDDVMVGSTVTDSTNDRKPLSQYAREQVVNQALRYLATARGLAAAVIAAHPASPKG